MLSTAIFGSILFTCWASSIGLEIAGKGVSVEFGLKLKSLLIDVFVLTVILNKSPDQITTSLQEDEERAVNKNEQFDCIELI